MDFDTLYSRIIIDMTDTKWYSELNPSKMIGIKTIGIKIIGIKLFI